MSDLGDLYQEVILDHYRNPRNFGALSQADRAARGDNPLCGDKLYLQVRLKGDVIEDLRFKGAGCAISVASASLMTESVKGRTLAEAQALFDKFHPMVTGRGVSEGLGKLEVFSGVGEFPVRVKCATLAWHTLRAALQGLQDAVSTE
jgi:nitrogen fixation NifU-like protein